MVMKRIYLFLLVPVLLTWTAQAQHQNPRDLVKDVVYNEQQDRIRESYWQYRVEKKMAQGSVQICHQVETSGGPIYRLLAYGNMPLNDVQKKQEEERLEDFLNSPSKQAHVRQQHEEDEKRIGRLMALMPDAFLYEYDGTEGNLERLKFKPNPQYDSKTMETRVFHALSGTVWIDVQHKRLSRFTGVVIDRVDFGYGLLGHLEKGGTFEIRRVPVNATHWKTDYIDVHLTGRVIFFKSINKDHHEQRTHFQPVADNITLQQAKTLLDHISQ